MQVGRAPTDSRLQFPMLIHSKIKQSIEKINREPISIQLNK